MDIIDIVLSRALTPQGQIESYAALAQRAVTNATNAVSTAENAVSTAQEAVTTVNSVAEAAQQTLTQLQNATQNIAQAAQDEIDKLAFELVTTTNSNAIENAIKVTYPSEDESTIVGITKYYKGTGNNQDGTMTQKAITNAIRANGSGSSGSVNFNPENSGHVVIVGEDGTIVPSENLTQDKIASILINSGQYNIKGTIGIKVNYENYTFTRTQDAVNKNGGNDFNAFPMYGGRMRCLVNNEGYIKSFYGDDNYTDTPENGYQVMIYQPKFYYSRIPTITNNLAYGKKVIEESITISAEERPGFSVHPLFINDLGEEVDYVLLSAYEGSIESSNGNSYTDTYINNFRNQKLSSVSGAKPISGLNNSLTVETGQVLANNRGAGWHITNMRFESAMQMLQTIEYGTFNLQDALEQGIGEIESSTTFNNSAITGSTAYLGNYSGAAISTNFTINGNNVIYNAPGYRAISYRGLQNPWGNMWRLIAGVNISGNGSQNGGSVFICNNYNYDVKNNTNYTNIGYYLPNNNGWISNFGYGNVDYNWAFIPVECSSYASSLLPVGDGLWVISNLRSSRIMSCGGAWAYSNSNGPFYYACDKSYSDTTSRINARLMFIPQKSNNSYMFNINKWQNKYGG